MTAKVEHRHESPAPHNNAYNHHYQLNWRQQLQQFIEQPIAANDRLSCMLFIREKVFGVAPIDHKVDIVKDEYLTELSLDDVSLIDLMLDLSERLCDWPMVIYLRVQKGLRVQPGNLAIANKAALSRTYHKLGLFASAMDNIHDCLLQDFQQLSLAQYHWQLQQTLIEMKYSAKQYQLDSVILTPLTKAHRPVFYWAFDDLQQAKSCHMPDYTCDVQWHNWLAKAKTEQNRYLMAINHQEWGFIACVSLVVHEGIGTFHLWLSQDFQDQDFTTPALLLLTNLAAKFIGMKSCYGKVHWQTQASQQTMQQKGFKLLPCKLTQGNDSETCYYFGAEENQLFLVEDFEQQFIQ
jgi:RimJ/RimL family protein N-acetyltransferase